MPKVCAVLTVLRLPPSASAFADLFVPHVEKALVSLRKQQREKIEEVKQKTNYYSMRNLIERYEESPGPASGPGTPAGLRHRIVPPPPQMPLQPASPAGPQTPQRNLQVSPQTPAPGQLSPGLQQQLSRECPSLLRRPRVAHAR